MLTQPANATNEAGGRAYRRHDAAAVAQLACTGTKGAAFYIRDDGAALDELRAASAALPDAFLAQTAVYARTQGYRKDTPALLAAVLFGRRSPLLPLVFDAVIDNGRMLRNFVGFVRDGRNGRRSLGRRGRRLIQAWFDARTDAQVLAASVGKDPSLEDVLRLAHVHPRTPQRAALFRYLLRRPYSRDDLPPVVQSLLRARESGGPIPDVPFQLLVHDGGTPALWAQLADNARWHMTRMNLNTFARHGVFDDPARTERIAARLRDPHHILRARAMPYQLLVTLEHLDPDIPSCVRDAVEDALEQTLTRVTTGPGDVTVAVDVSGSMSSTVSPRSRVRCVDVGALFGAALTRSNPDARLLTFNTVARPLACDGPLRQTTHAIRDRLGGGTACAAPLEWLLHRDQRPDLVVLISDSESWYDTSVSRQTRATAAWRVLLRRNPDAKLVSLDLQPYRTSQVPEHESILHIGGFSDRLFDVIRRFREHALGPGHWVREIERTQLPTSPALLPALRDGMAS